MLNIACTHGSVVLVIFHYYLLQNKESNSYSFFSMTSVVVLFAHQIKLNILARKRVASILPKKLYMIILTHLPNAIKKMLDNISFHKHFKDKGTKSLCAKIFFRPVRPTRLWNSVTSRKQIPGLYAYFKLERQFP